MFRAGLIRTRRASIVLAAMEKAMATRLLFLALGLGIAFKGYPEEMVSNTEKVKVAAVQLMGYDKTGNAEEGLDPVGALLPYIERAGNDDVDLVVFPEYHLGRIRVPGPETRRIAEAVRRENLYVIVGAWELLDGGNFANAALLFGRDGELLGKYHKTHAAVDQFDKSRTPWTSPPPDRDDKWFIKHDPEWKMERGQRLPVFELDFGTIAILTCYDGWFPEPWRVVSLKGAELVVWLNCRCGLVEDFLVRIAMFWN